MWDRVNGERWGTPDEPYGYMDALVEVMAELTETAIERHERLEARHALWVLSYVAPDEAKEARAA